MSRQTTCVRFKRFAYFGALLAGVALAVGIGPARPQTVLAQSPPPTCTAPNPALRFPAAQKYFMVVVDSSGSMTTGVTGAADSCGYRTGVSPYAGQATRIDHARCAVDHIVTQFSGTVDFGISQYATLMSSGSSVCFQSWGANCYPQEQSTTGLCVGCGPRTGGASTRAGARILAPISSNSNNVLPWVDNNCSGGIEVGAEGNTPLNGALRDMKRYFQTGWLAPDSSASYPTPLTGNTCTGRSINVLLVTDGDETCDTQADAVAAAQDLFVTGVTVGGVNYKVKTYVVNFAGGNQSATDQIAAAGGTGASYFATNEAQLLAAMQTIMAAPTDPYNHLDDDCNSCVDDGWADLSLTGSASPAVAGIGEGVTYTFEAHNAGPTDADAKVLITSVLFGGALSPAPTLVGPSGWSCVGSSCTNPDFAVGDMATFTLSSTISATATDGWTPTYTLQISPIQYVKDQGALNNTASAHVTVHLKTTPTITWPAPADIVYGTALGGTQLNATASVSGSLVYSPLAGTVLSAGNGQTLSVSFTPDDATNYDGASASVTIDVLKATPTVTATGGTFTYDGSAHPATASATGVGGASLTPVTITYNGGSSEPVSAGIYNVVATFGGDTNYESASATATITINKAGSTITWPTPSAITYGTALGGSQLNATASVPGGLVYAPAAGTVLSAGAGQTLSVVFTPTDSTNYASATASVSIDVLKATPTVTVTGGTFAHDGSPHPATASATGVGGVSLGPVTVTYGGDPTPPVSAGTYVVVATYAGDANYKAASATASLTIIVVNKPPVCTTATAKPSQLWPPNRDMERIQILGVSDPGGDPVSLLITGIFQDEPTNTDGDRNHTPDGRGVGTSTAYVRAERGGNKYRPGNGRVYHISFTASDGRGGTCTGEVTVGVPHDASRGPAIDDGPRDDSTVTAPPLPGHDEDNCSDDRHDHRPKKDGRGDDRDGRSGPKGGGDGHSN